MPPETKEAREVEVNGLKGLWTLDEVLALLDKAGVKAKVTKPE